MTLSVSEAARILEGRGALGRRRKNQAAWVVEFVAALIGRPIPADLADFYRENIAWVGDFQTTVPVWNDHVSRVTDDAAVGRLMTAKAIPLFWDGCGSLYGVDVSTDTDHPAVYFFDHEHGWERPAYAAGSSIGTFLLLLAEHDAAIDEKRPPGWELEMDPELGNCPRAPPIWLAD